MHAPDRAGEIGENALDLLTLVQHETAQLVVHLQHFLRLDEHRRAALGTVVNEALDAALVFRLDGNDEPVPAYGDNAVLQVLLLLAGKIPLQAGADALA